MSHTLENGWQEGAEAVQKNILAKLDGTAVMLVSTAPA